MQHGKFHYADLASLEAELLRLGVHLPLSTDLSVLKTPVQAGRLALANRLAVQPMEGCDGTPEGSPGELTLRRYDRFAESGAALGGGEACAVVREGRADPRHLGVIRPCGHVGSRLLGIALLFLCRRVVLGRSVVFFSVRP